MTDLKPEIFLGIEITNILNGLANPFHIFRQEPFFYVFSENIAE